MRIEELTPGTPITILASINNQQAQFESRILEVNPKKRIVLAESVFIDDKVVTFRAKALIVNIVISNENDSPQIFKNVMVQLVKHKKEICYNLVTIAESKPYNRRESFRCYVGITSSAQIGANRTTYDIIIKDVSITGFSFVCSNELKLENHQIVHTVLKDYLEELAEDFSFHLYGIVVRSYPLDNNRLIYGCRLNSRVFGLESYITKKERLRIKRMNGGRL